MPSPCPARFDILLLDFGGVCIPHPFEQPEVMADAFGLRVDQLPWAGPTDPGRDPLYVRQQAGEITEREYWGAHAATLGRWVDGTEWALLDMMRRFHERVVPDELLRPEATALADAARAEGVRVAVMSNDLRDFAGEEFVARCRFLQLADPIVDASVTGVFKPAPQAYAIALDALGGPDPATVLFVDDQAANAAGGRSAGMAVLHFDVLRPTAGWWMVAEELFCAAFAELLYGPRP
ncbi:MAG: HAD-IA family hydrolase [Acidimicrobiales bacterium]|nr:HAD-IA family hydrolase [Acidimicrobiales bacterium]